MVSSWQKGVWVGRSAETDEHVVATPKGVRLTRTVHRMEKGREWDINIFKKSCGVPWNRRRGAALRVRHPTVLPGAPVAQPVEVAPPEAVYEADQNY
eukprot:13747093-Alexandrium_andersonii.AAC.1